MESQEKSPVIERFIQFMNFTGLSSSQFADKADIPRPSLSQMLHGRNKSVNNQILSKLNEAFPNLNILWLLFGQGDMLKDSNIEFSEPQNDQNQLTEETEYSDSKPYTPIQEPEIPNLFTIDNQHEQVRQIGPKPQKKTDSPTLPLDIETDDSKKISSIIVLYTDGSFETFKPA